MSCKIHHNETITAVLVNHIEAAKFSQAAWSRKKEARNHDSVKQQNLTSTFINHVEAGKTKKKKKEENKAFG